MSDERDAGEGGAAQSSNNADQVGPIGWRDLHLWEIQPVRDVLLGLAVLGLFVLGEMTSVVTVPLLLAILLAYLFEPAIGWVERRAGLSRPVVVGGLIGATVLFLVVPAIVGISVGIAQLAGLIGATSERVALLYDSVQAPGDPALADRLATEAGPAWSWMRERLLADETRVHLAGLLESLNQRLSESGASVIGSTASFGLGAVERAVGLIGGVFGFGFMVFLTLFFFFFVSTGWVGVKGFARKLLPVRHADRIVDLAIKFDRVISAFIRGRLTIAFVQAVVFSIAYAAIGVPAAFLVGPAVAVLSIVPYLALVGIPVSMGLLWLEGHTGVRGAWWWVLGAPLAVYFLGQALDDYVLTPAIQGKSTNMDTPTILFATLAGGALFGVFGMLIAIPLAACVKILIAEIVWPAFKEWAEGRSVDPLPIERD